MHGDVAPRRKRPVYVTSTAPLPSLTVTKSKSSSVSRRLKWKANPPVPLSYVQVQSPLLPYGCGDSNGMVAVSSPTQGGGGGTAGVHPA